MARTTKIIASQQMEKVHAELGGELCRALETLTQKLAYEFEMPWGGKGASMRAYAELREAKSRLSYLKYPDPMESMPADEMAWALGLAKCSYTGNTAALFDKTAKILGIDLTQTHAIPQELDRKISNALLMMTRTPLPMAVAST